MSAGCFASLAAQHWAARVEQERDTSRRLLLNILPTSIAGRLKRSDDVIADRFDDVTVLFTDPVGFTTLSTELERIGVIQRFGQNHDVPLSMRAGIHTGEVVAGVIGKSKFSYDLWGDTVNTAGRMGVQRGCGDLPVRVD